MKKILILLSVLFVFSLNNVMATTVIDNDDEDRDLTQEEIDLINIGCSSGVGPVSMPLLPDVEAWKSNVIIVQFNRNLGEATVIIYDENGNEVDYAFYDTSFTGKVTLSVPSAAGRYSLYIGTAHWQKEGYFNIL